jgi:Xaa-Pro aminopeptidase
MNAKMADIENALGRAQTVYDALCAAAVPGASETDLDTAIRRAAQWNEISYDLLSGPRTAAVEGGAAGRGLHKGDAVLLDLCLKEGEHWCDVCRTFFLGEAPEPAKKAYKAALACFDLIAGMLRGNVKAKALYQAAERFFDGLGMKGNLRHHVGHGIGRTPFEAPVAVLESADVLKTGDVVTVEIGLYWDGELGVRVEDDFLLTHEGAINLWAYPRDLKDVTLPFDSE